MISGNHNFILLYYLKVVLYTVVLSGCIHSKLSSNLLDSWEIEHRCQVFMCRFKQTRVGSAWKRTLKEERSDLYRIAELFSSRIKEQSFKQV